MSTKKLLPLYIGLFLLFCLSCTSQPPSDQNRIVIGISADVQTFNPLFTLSYDEGAITELMYLSLMDFRWDAKKGELKSLPMLAKKWEWAEDSSYISFYLRSDIYWTDSVQITSEDVVFSLDVYSDPVVQSRLYGSFISLYTDEENHIDIDKTCEVLSGTEFKIYFKENVVPYFYDLSFPLIPKHIFDSINREELITSDQNFNPVSSGPFKLKKWNKNQTITLEANKESFLYDDEKISELVFKVVPDYTSRILQLKKGELDLIERVKSEDIEELKLNNDIEIVPIIGREYDYVGWNNIDPVSFSAGGKIEPHKLFGNSNVRKALTHAINRQEILDEYLLGYGEIAVTPVSTIFTDAFNDQVIPYEYNIQKAKALLEAEGWKDLDSDGILEKGKDEFSFTLYYAAGNPLREFASTVIKNNLKAIGVDMDMEAVESGAFINDLFEKKLDAWMSGWTIPIPLELKQFWYSGFDLNFVSYQSKEADNLMDLLELKIDRKKKNILYKQFQEIIHRDEPVTFLYWVPNICAYDKKLKNINITPFGVVTHCWEWTVKPD